MKSSTLGVRFVTATQVTDVGALSVTSKVTNLVPSVKNARRTKSVNLVVVLKLRIRLVSFKTWVGRSSRLAPVEYNEKVIAESALQRRSVK